VKTYKNNPEIPLRGSYGIMAGFESSDGSAAFLGKSGWFSGRTQ